MTDLNFEGVEQTPVSTFAEKAYLDYSMYVILDRALPHIADGLKPVQRRIVYAMSELGLKASSKHKKSARTVGDVLGKYHPHGDTACYEAMVLMAQPFSYRYPLVDGQGNWGSADDPKSFAAMRYTESRLAPYAEVLLSELEQGTVDWIPNFDASLDEPKLLPARLPNVLLNGVTGIAVGMATDIPPHNLREVASACIHLLMSPKASIADLCTHIKGPDYPTAAEIITPRDQLRTIYETGVGSIKMRAVYATEKEEIIITALPYQVSGEKILEQIAVQMRAKKLPMVVDLRDESDHENPTRLVVVLRSNRVDADAVMLHLFASTDLERSYRVNMNMIGINGRPQVKDIKTLLKEWLMHRTETVRRRLQHRLDKVLTRMHILEGLLVAFLNIDEVIGIIREEDEPKPALISRFNLSDKQAEAILEIKLRQLAKLEEIKIRGEQDELNAERGSLEKTLGSPSHLKTLVRKELEADALTFGDDRRSPIIEREQAVAMKEEEMVSSEPVTIILSQKGWIRSAKGHEIDPEQLSYKAGDCFKHDALGRANQQVVFFDSTGRAYSVAAHTLPSARGQGEPLTRRLKPAPGATFEWVLSGDPDQTYLIASDAGYGFISCLKEFYSKNRAGKAALKCPKGAKVLAPFPIRDLENQKIVVVSNLGRLLIFQASELPVLARGKGNKMMSIPAARVEGREEFVQAAIVCCASDTIVILSGKRHLHLKPSDWQHYVGERARRGSLLPKGYQRVTRIAIKE